MMRCLLLLALVTLQVGRTQVKPTGISHVALFVKDIERARWFYQEFLGFQPADSTFNINSRQFIELLPERESASDRLAHIAFEASEPRKMQDPDGHIIEFVRSRDLRYTNTEQVSQRLLHAGILVGSIQKAMGFYRDTLGFQETWRGSRDGKVLSWINLKVPNGTDYIEFMLYDSLPAPDRRGTQHHICLEVPDIEAAKRWLEARPARKQYERPLEIRTGTNRRRQLNLYDPDGTRVELMEPNTVDGVPAPSSTAPPPRP